MSIEPETIQRAFERIPAVSGFDLASRLEGAIDMELDDLSQGMPCILPMPAYLPREASANPDIDPRVLKAFIKAYGKQIEENWPCCQFHAMPLIYRIPVFDVLCREWPHASSTHAGWIAYTRNVDKGMADRQEACKPGSYLQRIFGGVLPGHEIEKLCAPVVFHVEELRDEALVESMLDTRAVSCMTKGGWTTQGHPYRVYASQYGWSMISRVEDDVQAARCLVNGKKYVRIYGVPSPREYSRPDDPALRQWLDDNGYEKIDSWAGFKLARIPWNGSEFLAPYLDGRCSHCTDQGDHFAIDGGGYEFDTTDGRIDIIEGDHEHDGQVETIDGDWIDEDDACYIHDSEETGYLPSEDVGADLFDEDHRCSNLVRLNADHYGNGVWGFRPDCRKIYVGRNEVRTWFLEDDCVETVVSHRLNVPRWRSDFEYRFKAETVPFFGEDCLRSQLPLQIAAEIAMNHKPVRHWALRRVRHPHFFNPFAKLRFIPESESAHA